MLDGKSLGEQLASIVKDLIAPLRERLAVVETRGVYDDSELRREVTELRERAARLEERKPDKGERGADGFGFDDMAVEYDGERTFTLKFQQGERTKEFPFTLPFVLDRGVYKEGEAYERGDSVTWAGQLWIAQQKTAEKPGPESGWRLAVRKGRDAKAKVS